MTGSGIATRGIDGQLLVSGTGVYRWAASKRELEFDSGLVAFEMCRAKRNTQKHGRGLRRPITPELPACRSHCCGICQRALTGECTYRESSPNRIVHEIRRFPTRECRPLNVHVGSRSADLRRVRQSPFPLISTPEWCRSSWSRERVKFLISTAFHIIVSFHVPIHIANSNEMEKD